MALTATPYDAPATGLPPRPAAREATETIKSYNPATGELIGEVPVHTAEDVRQAAGRAREAQRLWAALPVQERARYILNYRDILVDRAGEVADLIVRENGKTKLEAMSMELFPNADLAGYFAKRAHKILAPKRIPLHLAKVRKSVIHYRPRGVVGIISPWNFPFSIAMGDVIMALLAGNAVVLKPSEITPFINLKGKELMDAAGLPKDLFQVVTGYGPTGAALIEAGVNKIVFTGSVRTGKLVAEACARQLIPCVLELGGKAPCIVLEDADLDRAVNAVVWGGFANSGQVCASVERCYVAEPIYRTFVDRVVVQTKRLRQGDPASPQTDVGAMPFPPQLENCERLVQQAVAKGAKVETGGKRREGKGQFFEPTILTGVNHDMDVMRKETFGPVIPIMPFRTEEEVIRLANDSHLGLTAYVFSRDKERALRVAGRIDAGTVQINDVLNTHAFPETPWGGTKQSGLGRIHSDDGLRDLCEKYHINVENLVPPQAREPFWYPYSEGVYRFFSKVMAILFRRGLANKLSALGR